MPPEALSLVIISSVFLVAYEVIYPKAKIASTTSLMKADAITSLLALVLVGAIVGQNHTHLQLGPFEIHWFVFTIIVGFCVEIPLYLRFCKRTGLTPFDDEDT